MNDEYPPSIRKIVERIDPSWPPTIDVNAGWFSLLERLDATLAALAPNYRVQQVKSKFGSLSFSASPSDDPYDYNEAFNEAIRVAEWASIEVCEVCGAPAKQYVIRMWVWTACNKHADELRSKSD